MLAKSEPVNAPFLRSAKIASGYSLGTLLGAPPCFPSPNASPMDWFSRMEYTLMFCAYSPSVIGQLVYSGMQVMNHAHRRFVLLFHENHLCDKPSGRGCIDLAAPQNEETLSAKDAARGSVATAADDASAFRRGAHRNLSGLFAQRTFMERRFE